MRRTTAVVSVLALASIGAVGAYAYTAVGRERTYDRLIAEGDAALAADQTSVAIESFSGAIALKPNSMLAHLKRGETYRRRGDLSAAIPDLRAAARIDPTATRPPEELGDLNYALGRYARAAESYQTFLRLDDRSAPVHYKLALARYRDGKPAAAVDALRLAIGISDRFAEAHYLLGLCLKDSRSPREAQAALERAVTLSPGLMAAREELADLYESAGRRRDAIDQLEALAALEPTRPERQIDLALSYARSGQTDLAVITLGRAAERHPEHTGIYTALGRVWLDIADARKDRVSLSKALEALDQAAARPDATSTALELYGRALIAAGDLPRAESVLQQAMARYPVDPLALERLAQVALKLGHIDLARTALTRVFALDPGTAATQADRAVQIADLSLRMRQPPAAVSWLRRAIDVNGSHPALVARLVDAQYAAGDAIGARDTLDLALQKDPGSPALAALKRRMR
jgi:tetratricopeptide (TPR) repeat protein